MGQRVGEWIAAGRRIRENASIDPSVEVGKGSLGGQEVGGGGGRKKRTEDTCII